MRKNNRFGLEQNERGIWLANFTVAGRRIQRTSTHTQDRAKAEEYCSTLETRIWREQKLGEQVGLKWEVGVADWFKDKEAERKRDLANDRDKALRFAPYLDGHYFHQIHTNPQQSEGVNINDVLEKLQAERKWGAATRNRNRSFVVGVFNHAREKGYNVPFLKPRRLKERQVEQRALVQASDEAPRLFAALPLHLNRPGRFSLACGARQANVFGLHWWDKRYYRGELRPHLTADLATMVVPSDFSKSKKKLVLPMNSDAIAAAREARDCRKHGDERLVFTYHGAAIEQPYNTAFIGAVKECGLDGFTWHGFRHTWTTWHLENGTPVEVVMKLGGWSSIHVLLKHYAHLIHQHVAKFAGNVAVPAAEQREAA